MKRSHDRERKSGYMFLLIFFFLSVGIITAGYFAYYNYKQRYRVEVERQLSAVADLKEHELVQWRKERLGDANVFYKNIVFSGLAKRYFADQTDADAKKKIKAFMRQVQSAYSYSRISLYDDAGVERMSIPEEKIHTPFIFSARSAEVLKSGKVEFQDFYRDENDNKIYLTIFIPIIDEYDTGKVLGVLDMRIDPTAYLYPFIQTWPTSSKSAETLLLRREGNDVLYLNELRHKSGTALNLRIPIQKTEVPAVMAALGQTGLLEGVDYRDVPVVAFARAVPNSPWFLIAKIDTDEVFEPLTGRLWLMISLMGALIAAVGAGVGFIWWYQRNRFHHEQYKADEALRDSEERYRTTMMSVGDGVITTDTEGRLELLNPVAEALTGWRQEEARSKPLEEVFRIINEETRQIVENPVRRVMREGIVVGLANHSVLIAKDGTEHPIADSGAPIRSEKGAITGVVLVFRDQTQERMAQKALRESERKFRETVTHLDEGYYSCMMDGVLLEHNRAFNRILGFAIDQDLKGEKLPDFWQNPDDRNEYLNELMTKGFIRNFLINAKSISGEKLVVMANSHLVKDEKGGLVRIEGTFTDFTESKHAESELAAAHQLYRDLFENVNVGILRTTPGPEGAFIDMNPAMVKLFEADSREQLLSLHPSEIYWDASQRKIISDAIVAQGFAKEEIRFKTLKGKPIWCHINSVRKIDANNQVYFDNTIEDFTERKRVEEALQKSEKRLREAQEMAHLGFWTWDVKTGEVEWSEEVFKIFCLDPKEFTPQIDSILTLSPWPEDHQRDQELIKRAIETRSPGSYEQKFLRPDKSIGHYYSTFQGNYDEKGDLISIVGTVLDITERKRAEEALQASEVRFRIAAETSNDVVYEWDLKQEVKWFGKIDEMLGYAPGEFPRTLDGLGASVHPEDWVRVMAAVQAHLEGRAPYAEEYRAIRKDGTFRWWSARGAVARTPDGKPVRWVGTVTDITERKLAEQELLEREARYKTLVENIPQKIFMKSRDYRWISVNENMARDLGISPEEAIGKLDSDFFPRKLADKYRADDVRIMETGNTEELEEKYMVAGKETWVNTIKTPVRDKNGEIMGVLGVFWDITQRKLAESQIRKLNRMYLVLSEVNQAIVRIHEPKEMFEKVCRISVEQGGFAMAWIGLIDESSQKIQVIARAGKEDGYLEKIDISLNGEPLKYCPIDSALRQGKHSICTIIENKETAPCQKLAYDLGFRSSASLPLKVSNTLRGALTFYSNEPEFFEDEELKLLDEMASDISFAMEYAEKEAERKRVEQSLKVVKDSLEEAQHVARVGSWEWDAVKDEITASEEFFRLFDVVPEQIARFSQFSEQLHPDDRERVQQDVAAALKRDRPYDTDYRVKLRDEGWRDINARGRVITDAEGKPLRMVGTCLDISERKRAEETLRESEAKYRTLVQNIPQKIVMKDKEYRWISINETFAKDLGLRPEEVVGKVDADFFPPELAAKYRADDVRIIETGQTDEFDEHYVQGGQEVWVHTIKTPVRDKRGETVGVLVIFSDITERKRAEDALRISQERLLFATEGANLGIWNWNIVTGELIWSDQCKALFGVPPDETMTYQRFSDALHPDDRERTDKAVKDTLDNHKDFDIEYRSLWPDESIHWLAAKGRGFYDATGKAVRLEGIVLDIAEIKRTEEEIRKLNTELEDRVTKRTAQLEASNKELEAFSYSVSHDLRAPLRHVSGYVELLAKHFKSELSEKGVHYLDSIADSARQMGKLIDNLLQFSRTGRAEMHRSPLEMNGIVREVTETVRKDNPGRAIKWVVGKLPSVSGDDATIRLVWINLLSNAVKFTRTREKALIEIGANAGTKEVTYFVRDNGVGFDMKYAQKLFGVFQRLHSTEEFEGTGIGLANVRRIITRHGGRTWAEAEINKGATFYFSIPHN